MKLVLPSLSQCAKGLLLIAVFLLDACATGEYISDIYKPNFGLRVFPHFDASVDPDPIAIANGLYAPRPLQNP
jgi:hypothetical protein